MALRSGSGAWKRLCAVVMSSRKTQDGPALVSKTYGSNSARGREGADGAGALAEGGSEHIDGVLYVPREKRKTIAIDLQLCGEEIRWAGKAVAWFRKRTWNEDESKNCAGPPVAMAGQSRARTSRELGAQASSARWSSQPGSRPITAVFLVPSDLARAARATPQYFLRPNLWRLRQQLR